MSAMIFESLHANRVLSREMIETRICGDLLLEGNVVTTLRGISATTGKNHYVMSLNACAIASSVLSGQTVLGYSANIPKERRGVLYFSTDKTVDRLIGIRATIMRMASLTEDQADERLLIYNLREDDVKTRMEFLERTIEAQDGIGLVIIDNISDLINDVNSSEESRKVSTLLMRLASQREIHIHVLLNQNKANDNVRGHLGSEIWIKSDLVLQLAYYKSTRTCKVSAELINPAVNPKPFTFTFDEKGFPVPLSPDKNADKTNHKDFAIMRKHDHLAILIKIFPADDILLQYKDCIEMIADNYKCGYNKAVSLLKYLQQNNYILKTQDRRNKLNPEFRQVATL